MSKHKYNLRKDEFDERDYLFKNTFVATTLPQSVDLRPKMPPVYDQKTEGSCTANGGVGDREYMLQDKNISLSRQFLYNVERLMEGTFDQDAGAQMRTICKCLNTLGVCEEKYLPYGEENLYVKPSQEAYNNALKYKIASYHRVLNKTEMKQALAQGLPILIGINVFTSFEQGVKDDGFIPQVSPNEELLGGHCVLIVGYKDNSNSSKLQCLLNLLRGKQNSKGYFILRNSWSGKSTSEGGWGDKGYGYLPYEVFDKIVNGDMWVITK